MSGPVARFSNLDFFLARVEQSRAEGEAATLSNVKERCRRAEAAWQMLADRALQGEQVRQRDALRKSADRPEGLAGVDGY